MTELCRSRNTVGIRKQQLPCSGHVLWSESPVGGGGGLRNDVLMSAATADNESAVLGSVGLMFVSNANCRGWFWTGHAVGNHGRRFDSRGRKLSSAVP